MTTPKIFYKKNKMMDAINHQVKDKILLSADYRENSQDKNFRYLLLKNTVFNHVYLNDNRHMYEILPPTEKVKLYFDLEMEYEGFERTQMEHCCEEFIFFVATEIKKLFGITLLMSDNDLVIEDSCRQNKLSYHIIINNKLYFDSVPEMKLFISYLKNRFDHPETDEEEKLVKLLTYHTNKGEKRYIFDTIPYSKFQNFRFLGQSKLGKEHVLKNWTPYWEGIDTFVRLYYGEGDRKLISKEMLDNLKQYGDEKIKKSKTLKKKKDINCTEESIENFNKIGLTLFSKFKMLEKDLYKLSTWKRALYLIPNTHQNWDIYRNVAMAVRGANGKLEDFVQWAKLSPKYVPNDAIEKDFENFNTQKSGEHCYGLTYLRNLAKQCYPEYFRGAKESLNRYFELDTTNLKVIKEKSQFVSMEGTPDANNILDEAKTIILHAYLGRGKTTAIKRLLKNYTSYLFLSPRQTFAKFISAEFEGTVCYMDCNGVYKHNKFVISVESLYKLEKRDYDVICLDESESIFAQFSSSTMRGQQLDTWKIIEELINNAKKVIYADAFITNRTLDIARHFGGDITLIQNETPAIKRVVEEIPADEFASQLLKSIKSGNKNYVCYSSVNKLIDNVSRLQGAGLENEEVKNVMDNALIYHAKVGDEVFDSLSTIGDSWRDASMVITSPTNTIGCSYSPNDAPDFDEVWVNAFPTCVVRDTFQTQMRVRHLKSNKMVLCLPSPSSLNFCKMRHQLRYDVFDAYEENTKNKEMVTKQMISQLISLRQSADKNDDCFELIELAETCDNHTKTPEVLKRLYFANFYEETVSAVHYEDMFRCFLSKCGYSADGLSTKKSDDDKDSSMVQVYNEEQMYENIPNFINTAQREVVEKCIKSKKATAGQKLQMMKYWFDKTVSAELNLEQKTFLFHEVYSTRHGKEYIDNLKLLHNNVDKVSQTMNKDNILGGCGFELNEMTGIKLAIVKEFNKQLGIKNAGIGGDTITREQLMSLAPYIEANKLNINTAFKFRDRSKNGDMNLKQTKNIVQKVYENWCGLTFKVEKNTHTDGFKSCHTKQLGLKDFDGEMF